MSDAGADRVDARLTGLEATVEQLDTRLGELNGRMNERFDTLETQIQHNREEIHGLRTEFRRWLLAFFAALSLVFTIVSVAVQVAL